MATTITGSDIVTGSGFDTSDVIRQGTWAVTDASGAGVAVTGGGKYTRVGNMVMITGTIATPSSTDTTSNKFGGLPFATGSTADTRGSFAVGYENASTDVWGVLPDLNNNTFTIRSSGSTISSWATLTADSFFISGVYWTEDE